MAPLETMHDHPLRAALRARELPYRVIATHTGLSESAVRNYLHGSPARPETLDKLKRALTLDKPPDSRPPPPLPSIPIQAPSAATQHALAPFAAECLVRNPAQTLTCADLLQAADVWCRG